MSGLNKNQLIAVNTTAGPLLVLAGAGTGKTRVITFRIAKLIQLGIAPNRILAMTFTNKAANEMKDRIEGLLAPATKKKKSSKPKSSSTDEENIPQISTFHSLCVKILRRHITVLGYPGKFGIYSRGDQESLARQILREIRVTENLLDASQMLYWIGRWKCQSLTPPQANLKAANDAQHLAAVAYGRYQKALKLKGCVDFDDLLLLTEKLFDEHAAVLREEAERFDHILVDEYQDTNLSQYRIVKALAERHRNLCVVGDDDQSIYGWRGAEVEHILSFHKDWPDTIVVRLEDNYRSTHAIIEMANTLIKHNKVRNDKTLIAARPGGERPKIHQFPNEQLEAEEVVKSIQQRIENHHRQPGDFAILFRTNEQTRIFETELRNAELSYVLIGGMSFFDRREVKDILAYLRLLDDEPDEISLLRIINTPPRGIGKQTIETLINHSIKHQIPLWDVITGKQARPSLSAAAIRGLEELKYLVDSAHEFAATNSSLVDLARFVIENSRYRKEIERNYDDPEDREIRWNTVEQIVNALAEYQGKSRRPSLREFLDKLLLGEQDPADDKEKQLKKNAIALMTMHSAKGLEFPEVYLVGLEEGILPHHRSLNDDEAGLDEERRLCYVGVTRAEERLTLAMALTRLKWGKPRPTHPSRFLYELSDQIDHPNYKPNQSQSQAQSQVQSAGRPKPALAPRSTPGNQKRVPPKK